jgi:AcrR family transcriptional regulator
MGRPRVHTEETEAALIASAERLLQSGGLEHLSVRAVAAGAGTSVQAIYSVFGDKDGLLRALYAEAFSILMGAIEAVPRTDDPVGDLVRIGTDAFRPFALDHPNLFRLAFEQLVTGVDPGTEARQAASSAFAMLRARIERAAPGARNGDIALLFHALCQGLASSELQGFLADADSDPALVWQHGFSVLVSGLTADLRSP